MELLLWMIKVQNYEVGTTKDICQRFGKVEMKLNKSQSI